ncbi:hypothetical protein J2S06_001633 [Bacillus alveayuensis]|uniref:Uncharacterized protein n=1 Tax=Aeribacillus alveayuensis TaxID=279215 RepID=A0ABT9VNJ7_9BACI|nr:hypothetical protein [Bacillus alveayuensis]
MKATNIVWHHSKVTKEDRQKLNGHKSVVFLLDRVFHTLLNYILHRFQ